MSQLPTGAQSKVPETGSQVVAATSERTGRIELLQALPLVWGEDQKELHPHQVVAAGLLLGLVWICMHLFASSRRMLQVVLKEGN